MKAVLFEEKEEMTVEDVPEPEIAQPTDAILRVTTTAICGSDLHMYEGRTGLKPGTVVGHEIMGVIEETGDAVREIKEGDRVVLPFNIACGTCYNCSRGCTNACLFANPDDSHAAYGYAGMGPYKGGQAEKVLVPFADVNCLKLPGEPGDEYEDDFLLLSDVFPTGYHGTELAHVQPGYSVAVFGAGPVGLLAVHSAILRGASEVYAVDFFESRLRIAEEFGAIPVNIRDGDPVEQIKAMRKENTLFQESLRPGEEKMDGVMCVVDAIGYQARDDGDYDTEKPTQVLENAVELANPTGHIGIVGVYIAPDPGAADAKKKQGIFDFPMGKVFDKGLTIGTGQTPVKKYNRELLKLIIEGKAKPSRIISHRISIDEAPEAYKHFDAREEGWTKVVIKML